MWFYMKYIVKNRRWRILMSMNCISLRSVLLVDENGVPGENHRPVASHRQTLSHIMLYWVHLASAGFDLTTLVVISIDCIGSYNYHTITTTTAPDSGTMCSSCISRHVCIPLAISIDCTGSYNYMYHTNTTTTAPDLGVHHIYQSTFAHPLLAVVYINKNVDILCIAHGSGIFTRYT